MAEILKNENGLLTIKREFYNAVLVRPEDKDMTLTHLEGFEDLKACIGCSMVQHISRTIGDNSYDIFMDEEGRLAGKQPALYDQLYEQDFVGNVIICGCDPIHSGLDIHNFNSTNIAELIDYVQLGKVLLEI